MAKVLKMRSSVYEQNRKIIVANLPKNCVCPYCNIIMNKSVKNHPAAVTIDHITPRSKGGQDTLDNLIAVCGNCNTKKASLNEVNLFYLTTPQKLNQNDYSLLNHYTKFFNRYTILKEIESHLKNEDFVAIAELIYQTKKTNNSASYFNMILKKFNNFMNKSTKFKNNHKKCCQWLDCLLTTELKHLNEYQQKTNHLNFTLYSMLSVNIKSQLIAA